MSSKEQIHNYWNEQALKFKGQPLATTPDLVASSLEIEEIKKYLADGQRVLDIGCGNGYKDVDYCSYKKIDLKGIDFSEAMIETASNMLNDYPDLKGRIAFAVGNVLELSLTHKYDLIITNRCLINLANNEEHIRAIKSIYDALDDQGVYLMMECTLQGLKNINDVRATYGLTPIEVRWHNCYLDESKVMDYLQSQFTRVEVNNFNSTYFLISRTLNALLTPEGQEPEYFSELNQYAAKLPPVGDFAPLKLFVCYK